MDYTAEFNLTHPWTLTVTFTDNPSYYSLPVNEEQVMEWENTLEAFVWILREEMENLEEYKFTIYDAAPYA
jgi:hypothetical protein